MPIPGRNWPCPEGVSSREVRGHFREERAQQRDAEQENDPDDGCGHYGTALTIQAAGREIRARSRREAETRCLILAALPPSPAPSVGRNQPASAEATASSKSAAADNPI